MFVNEVLLYQRYEFEWRCDLMLDDLQPSDTHATWSDSQPICAQSSAANCVPTILKWYLRSRREIDITATTVVDLYRSPWQGPVTLVIHHEADKRRMSVASVERP